ncbi:hypothetical protein BJ322DRAFT_552305 [Thelephora terrestris]|uniref:Uncharacterized protein n=1 Tax=Thelephora terrestris TaxID=56493 RepID=A0A9P6LAB6_9AGAM|nr:hypothetical protein BJ322DRAFT_552305 [Thelephora terrestris]
MYQLSDPAVEAILKEWHLREYNPPNTSIHEWIRTIESLCHMYGIPDTQRPQCATRFIRSGLRSELETVLRDARKQFGPVRWARFVTFMVELDRKFREVQHERPPQNNHVGTFIGAALFLTGAALFAPIAIAGALGAVGFTSAGVAAGSLAATVQSVVYGGATGGLFSLLQSAGATMVLPSAGTIITGVASTGAGIGLMGSGGSSTNQTVSDSIARGPGLGGLGGGDNADPPPYTQTDPNEYLLTPQAVQAIIKAWNIERYNPCWTGVTDWLGRLHRFCEVYGVPATQQGLCAMHFMETDCREAANAAGCHNMTWDQFTRWLHTYDVKAKFYFFSPYVAGLAFVTFMLTL